VYVGKRGGGGGERQRGKGVIKKSGEKGTWSEMDWPEWFGVFGGDIETKRGGEGGR